jgi:hypothetical protein
VAVDREKTVVIVAGSLAGTALIVALVFSLGGWAYHHREGTLHDGRLRRAVEQHPTVDQITEALLAEAGTRAVSAPRSDAEWRAFGERWPRASLDDIRAKQRRWPEVRVFAVPGAAYVLFFDAEGKLQDYALAGGPS